MSAARSGARSGARRERRSHAERSAQTRERILAAVVDCISEIGFQRTTASEIAARAGLTWGAVQHHFGGKDGILDAVLEDTFGRFAARFEEIPIEAAGLEQRAALFIERAWEHFASPHYRSTLEILLNHASARDESEAGDGPGWQERMLKSWDSVWLRLFADSPLPRRQRRQLAHYVLSALTGFAVNASLAPRGSTLPPEELALLRQALLRGLRGES